MYEPHDSKHRLTTSQIQSAYSRTKISFFSCTFQLVNYRLKHDTLFYESENQDVLAIATIVLRLYNLIIYFYYKSPITA